MLSIGLDSWDLCGWSIPIRTIVLIRRLTSFAVFSTADSYAVVHKAKSYPQKQSDMGFFGLNLIQRLSNLNVIICLCLVLQNLLPCPFISHMVWHTHTCTQQGLSKTSLILTRQWKKKALTSVKVSCHHRIPLPRMSLHKSVTRTYRSFLGTTKYLN